MPFKVFVACFKLFELLFMGESMVKWGATFDPYKEATMQGQKTH